ncbi:MAG: DUF1667 domain-containing protein [Candidatus Helarchaeota archaeon]
MSNPEIKVITCIGCPNGCQIEVTKTGDTFSVVGNECKKGEEYAIQEFIAPKRILTTTIQVDEGILPLIPVRTDAPIPIDKLFECMKYLSTIRIKAPISVGQILVKDILGLGVNIVASRDLKTK